MKNATHEFALVVEGIVILTEGVIIEIVKCFGCGRKIMCVFSEERKICQGCGAHDGKTEDDEVYAARQVFQDNKF